MAAAQGLAWRESPAKSQNGVAELAVDRPPEPDRDVLAGLAGDRRDPRQARQGLRVREACPAVPDLGEQPRGAQGPGAGQAGEDVRVRMGGELGADLGLQGLGLSRQGSQRGHQGAGDGRPGRPVRSGRPAGRGLQPRPQLFWPGGFPPVREGVQPGGQVVLAELASRVLRREPGQERQADRAVQLREQPDGAGERHGQVGAQLVARRYPVRHQVTAGADGRPQRGGRGRVRPPAGAAGHGPCAARQPARTRRTGRPWRQLTRTGSAGSSSAGR